jgi:hypothetical protein
VTLLDELRARATGSVLQTPVWTLSATEAYRLAYREAAELVAADPLVKAATKAVGLLRTLDGANHQNGVAGYPPPASCRVCALLSTLPKEE